MSTRTRKAFTLLELMVAFIIMAILLALAVPSISTVAQGDLTVAHRTSALSIADTAWLAAQNANPTPIMTASDYAGVILAQNIPGITVTEAPGVTGTAQFTFSSGAPVCVNEPSAAGNNPVAVDCATGVSIANSTNNSATTTSTTLPSGAAVLTSVGGTLFSVSCTSTGDCAAGGISANGSQAVVVDETDGVWGPVQVVANNLSAQGGQVSSVSCASAGNCGAVGYYYDPTYNHEYAFAVNETNGIWSPAQEVASNLGGWGYVVFSAASCASNGNCTAGGYFLDANQQRQAFVIDETNGVWGSAQEVAASLNINGDGGVNTVDCAGAGNCAVGGYYMNSSYQVEAFVIDETNGVWGSAQEVAGNLNLGAAAQLTSVSCVNVSSCTGVGFYDDGASQSHAFTVSENSGVWAIAQEVGSNLTGAQLTSVSCASEGNCSAVGLYTKSTFSSVFTIDELNGVWGTGQDIVTNLNVNGAYGYSISCANVGNCTTGGYYRDSSNVPQAFVVSETNGVWGTAQELEPGLNVNSNSLYNVSSVSCVPSGNCVAVGIYPAANIATVG